MLNQSTTKSMKTRTRFFKPALAIFLFLLGFVGLSQTAPPTTTVNNIKVNGDMVVEDVTVTKDTLKAMDHVVMQENLEVKKDVSISGHIELGNGLGMRSFAATANKPRVFNFGTTDLVNSGATSLRALDQDVDLPGCLTPFFTPNANPIYNFQGYLRAYAGASGAINLGHDGANGIIDVDGTSISSSQPGALLINYYCQRDIAICTGPADPNSNPSLNHVYIGKFLNAEKHVEIGNPTYPVNDPNNVALDINAVGGKGIRFNSYNNGMALLSVNNNNFTNSPFTVYGNGQTDIGAFPSQSTNAQFRVAQSNKNNPAIQLVDNTNSASLKDFFTVLGNGYTEIKVYSPSTMPAPSGGSPRAFTIKDMANNKDIFVVNANGKTYAREVEISLATTFPDYVFASDYKLKPLSEVEAFIKSNKHLPHFEKGEHYEKNGINVNDLLLKQQQTIEELMLYNIALEKRLKALEEKQK